MYYSKMKCIDTPQHHPHLLSPLCFAGGFIVRSLSTSFETTRTVVPAPPMTASSSSSWSDGKGLTPTASMRKGNTSICVQAESISPTSPSRDAGYMHSKFKSAGPYMLGDGAEG